MTFSLFLPPFWTTVQLHFDLQSINNLQSTDVSIFNQHMSQHREEKKNFLNQAINENTTVTALLLEQCDPNLLRYIFHA